MRFEIRRYGTTTRFIIHIDENKDIYQQDIYIHIKYNECEIMHESYCNICGLAVRYSHILNAEMYGERFFDCGGRDLTQDQYNCGILYPICYECHKCIVSNHITYESYHIETIRRLVKNIPDAEVVIGTLFDQLWIKGD